MAKEVPSPSLSFLDHLPLTRDAVEYAIERHGDQRRAADDAPFVLHTVEVASLLERSGFEDHVIAAAVLHDVLEHTDTERGEIEDRFGEQVAALVAAVSEDPAIEDEDERKRELRERVGRSGGQPATIFAADKISKVRELRMLLARGAPGDEIETKLERHRRSLEMLEDVIPGDRLVDVLRFEIEALEDFPPEP